MTPEVPVDTTPEIPTSIEAVTLPEAPVQAVPEELPVQKVEESVAEVASETQRKEGGLIGKLIDFFSKDEKAPLSEQVSVKEEETSQTEVVTAPVDVAAVESAPDVPAETPPEVPLDITPEIPVDTPTEVPVETTGETLPVQAEPEELPVQKMDESVLESVPETPQKEGGLIGKLIDLFSDDGKTSHSEQVAGKDEETSQTESVTASVDVAEVVSAPEVPAETPPEVPVDISPEIPVDTPTEVPIETTAEASPVQAEPEELPVQKTDESVVESVPETSQKEGGLIGKLIDFFSDDEKTSHSEQVAGKDEETSQTELVTAPVDVAEVGSAPEVSAETPPEVPVDIAPEVPVDTSSELSTGAETLAEVPAIETNAEAPPIQAEPEELPVQKSDESVVEAAPETPQKEGGLIGKLIDFFSDDEKTSQSEQVLCKEEETSQTELVTEPLGVAEEKPADSEVKVAEPAVEPQVDEKDQAEEQDTKVEEPSETGVEPKESVPEQELPISAEVSVKEVEEVKEGLNQEQKAGLIDKLVNLFSSDKVSDAAVETVTEQQVKEEEPVVSEGEAKEPASEVTVTEEPACPVIAEQEEAVTKDPEEPVSHVEPVEVKENVDGGLVGKLIGLFSKSEEKPEDAAVLKQTPEIEETIEKASDDKVADEMDFVIVEHSDVTEDKNVDPSDATAEKVTVDESTGITENKDVTSDVSGKSEGLIDKLLTFMSNTKEKETTDVSEVQEVPDVKQEVEPEPEVAEIPGDGKAEEAEITPKTDAAETPSVPAEGSGGLFSSLGSLFTKEKGEAVESTSDSSDKPDEKVIEDSTPSETVVAGPETATLEVKDKSLFDKIAELISSNDKNPEDTKDEALGSTTQESQTEPSQEELPQQAPAVEEDQQKPLSESSETETKPSLFDRVTNLFSKDSENAPIDKEPTVKEDSTEGSSSPDSKTATSEDDADVFVVLSKPTTPVETSPPEESQKEAEKATGWLQGSWFRSSASVSKEGKDVIIQVAPETPEKDYGQSNPDDADMYTTRK
ncbi:fibrous sheath CABYR-binding protein-like isoform X1 [Macrobrachium rosenbergii]|uniref:fibrous sheath CABYR-binding protein-like isoform X1 n=1 Tax=Macrobrachium rosenbergii TaxID=79674 RepID=UPI0034D569A0